MSIPSSMRAVRVHKTGDSSVLTLDTDVPLPAVKDADVLVKLDYAGVNFIDIYDRTGVYPQKLPFIAGREGAGTIVKLGSGVDSSLGLSEGDKVAVYAQGTIADFI
ncbi:MAG: alcohol dehydrogenase catalytic domain-containing protein, partial [Candidatus Binatia bacterium]